MPHHSDTAADVIFIFGLMAAAAASGAHAIGIASIPVAYLLTEGVIALFRRTRKEI